MSNALNFKQNITLSVTLELDGNKAGKIPNEIHYKYTVL